MLNQKPDTSNGFIFWIRKFMCAMSMHDWVSTTENIYRLHCFYCGKFEESLSREGNKLPKSSRGDNDTEHDSR